METTTTKHLYLHVFIIINDDYKLFKFSLDEALFDSTASLKKRNLTNEQFLNMKSLISPNIFLLTFTRVKIN